MTFPARLAANVAWLFSEHSWPDRFDAARRAGFFAVEFPWPADPAATASAVQDAGVFVAVLNVDAGNLAAGERGWPNDPRRIDEWRGAFDAALELAARVRCPTINVLAGNRLDASAVDEELACFEANLRWAVERAVPAGVTLVTELLNRRENPSYLLATFDEAEPLLERLGPLGWRLQLDTWHLGLTEPDVPAAILRAGGRIGHVQIADLPGRHEPGSGTLDWLAIRDALDGAGYGGAIGLEYRPMGGTLEGLREGTLGGWLTPP